MRNSRGNDIAIVAVAVLCLLYFAIMFVGCVVAIWYLVTRIPH